MSLEDLNSLDQGSEASDVFPKKPVLSYSREFLLSFSSLDICKKLPSGFDESILSEFEDALLSTGDRPKIPGSLPLHGYRRNEYSSSPPTRGDSGNYSRGAYGKWEGRSSGRSDRDSDSQPDKDAEPGRRFGHQPRRSWQSPEHDGLLGSGSFPRPSGYGAGVSGSKVRTNEQYQLSKSREPYHPPRPYKAVPHSRRDTDAFNDETFGSTESASEDKVEEERRRRASFELIRKEQHKALQEKQKSKMDKHNDGGISDLTELLEDDKDEKEPFVASKESEVSAGFLLADNLEKPSFAMHSPASKPVVPPGFCNNTQEKSSDLKSLILPSSTEVEKPVKERSLLDVEVNLTQNGKADANIIKQPAEATHHANVLNKLNKPKVQGSLDVPLKNLSYKNHLFPISSHFEADENLKDPEISELNAEVSNDKFVGDFRGSDSTLILEKIFGSTLSVHDASSNSVEHDDGKPDDIRSHSSAQSSKFAQWFLEEEDNVTNNISSARPNDLLSLIVTGDKANAKSDSIYISSKEEIVPIVLTCEDLEQSILSEYDADGKIMKPLFNSYNNNNDASTDQPVEHVDNRASLYLLSMLHKSTDHNTSMRSGDEVNLTNVLPVSHKHNMGPKVENNNQSSPSLGGPLTLETLFGNAFMKELQSVGAPVSAQRGPIGSGQADPLEPHEISNQFPDTESSSRVANGLQRSGLGGSSDNVNHTIQSKAENWLGFINPQVEIMSSNAPPINITDKIAAFGAGFNDFNSEVRHSSFDKLDHQIPHRNIPPQQSSSPQFGPQQVNQVWRPFHHIEPHSSHMSSSVKFLGPDLIFNHNSPQSDHQFPPNMIRPPPFNLLNPGFDAPPRHPMLHQMQMAGNYAPHMQMNHMQGLPLRPNLPNLGGRPVPGPADIISEGGNQYEAFERLIGMKLQANSNQIHSFPHGYDSGSYGADMGFQYR